MHRDWIRRHVMYHVFTWITYVKYHEHCISCI